MKPMRHKDIIDWTVYEKATGPNPNPKVHPTRNAYLFCSLEKMDDPDGSWLREFRRQAEQHGFELATTGGNLYLVRT